MIVLGSTWVHMGVLGSIWVYLGVLGCTRVNLGELGSTWVHLGPLGPTWAHWSGLVWSGLVYIGQLRSLTAISGTDWTGRDGLDGTYLRPLLHLEHLAVLINLLVEPSR